jgi:uncharacterized Tic20 family protein
MIGTGPTSSDRTAAILTHIGGIFLGFIPSLIVYLVATDNPWLKENARKALNFQLTMLIAAIISSLLILVVIGAFLLWAIGIVIIIFSILAAVKANNGEAYQYPLTIELIKN